MGARKNDVLLQKGCTRAHVRVMVVVRWSWGLGKELTALYRWFTMPASVRKVAFAVRKKQRQRCTWPCAPPPTRVPQRRGNGKNCPRHFITLFAPSSLAPENLCVRGSRDHIYTSQCSPATIGSFRRNVFRRPFFSIRNCGGVIL